MTAFAFFFPGQGSQSVGMMAGFGQHPLIKSTFEQASDILNVDFLAMASKPNELINATQYTQSIMLTAGVATWRVYQSLHSSAPAILAGHSLGEYTALVVSGAMSFEDALPLVKYRAEVMQNAVPEGQGAMAAILGLDDADVVALCQQAEQSEVVQAVNFNSPGQVVIAGQRGAVERAMTLAKEKGAKRVVVLAVSVPSHCVLMRPAAEQLAKYLVGVPIVTPSIPVLHNADVHSHAQPEQIKQALVKQLYSPVRWVETVQSIAKQNILRSAECGPGKVLSGLTKRIVAEMQCTPLVSLEACQELHTLV